MFSTRDHLVCFWMEQLDSRRSDMAFLFFRCAMSVLILIEVERLSSHRTVSRTVPAKPEQRLLICLYEEVPGLWSQGCKQAQGRDLLSQSELSEKGVLGEEGAGRKCDAAHRTE